MNYGLIISEAAAESLKDMDDHTQELFVLAMIDLARDPHTQGVELRQEGQFTDRAHDLGLFSTIFYTVDDSAMEVRITDVMALAN
jgi:mRNA-degrading endonuclease RelE of RelBE toxin-antitoxin system